jgi:hypothetical protein
MLANYMAEQELEARGTGSQMRLKRHETEDHSNQDLKRTKREDWPVRIRYFAQPQWNHPFIEDRYYIYPQIVAWQYFTDIVSNLTKIKNFGVSALDVAPILTPVPEYLTDRKYSQQFKFTVAQQVSYSESKAGTNGETEIACLITA